MLRIRKCAPIFFFFVVLIWDPHLGLLKSLGAHRWVGKGGRVRQCWMVELETKNLSYKYLDIFGASLSFVINFELTDFTFAIGC